MAAAIDPAAEVTILSDKIYNSLQDQPKIWGMQMDTIIVGPVKLEVGSKSYCTDVYLSCICVLPADVYLSCICVLPADVYLSCICVLPADVYLSCIYLLKVSNLSPVL